MNNSFVNFFFIAPAIAVVTMASTGLVSGAGSVAAPYQIGTWRGFRSGAISYTFDDDLPNQYAIAVPMFHALGFNMTLFTVTTNTFLGPSWTNVQQAAAYGDEIASHTITHPNLTQVSATQLTNELAGSQAAIDANVTNQLCVTLAYPGCSVPSESITAEYYIAARVCSGSLVLRTPSDFMAISSFVCGTAGNIQTATQFKNEANTAAQDNEWCVYLIHALDNDNGYSPLPSSVLQASLNYLSANPSKFWVETFGNVVRYIQERNASSVVETSNSGNSITVQVTNSLNTLIYNYPITLRRPLPTNWPAAAASQSNQPVNAQLVTIISTNYVMFDVVPNGGDIVISKTVLPFSISRPVLTTPTNLTFRLDGQSNVTYTLYSSSDLVNWLPIQTNTLVSTYTNFTIKILNDSKFYRAQWVP